MSGFFVLTSVLSRDLRDDRVLHVPGRRSARGRSSTPRSASGSDGIWSSTLFGSGGAIQWQRWQGTLELLVAAPAPFVLVVLPLTLATASIGLYSLCATLLWGRILFGVPFTSRTRSLFALALPVTILGLGLLGLVLAADVRPLPARERALEPARVPGLARHRPARPARAPARLGAADLVGARADLGHARAARRGARRRPVARAGDVARARRRLRRHRRARAPLLRAARPQARDAWR